MKVTRITLHIVNGPERSVAPVETDQGLTGLTLIERFTALDTPRQPFETWLLQVRSAFE